MNGPIGMGGMNGGVPGGGQGGGLPGSAGTGVPGGGGTGTGKFLNVLLFFSFTARAQSRFSRTIEKRSRAWTKKASAGALKLWF